MFVDQSLAYLKDELYWTVKCLSAPDDGGEYWFIWYVWLHTIHVLHSSWLQNWVFRFPETFNTQMFISDTDKSILKDYLCEENSNLVLQFDC